MVLALANTLPKYQQREVNQQYQRFHHCWCLRL